MTDDKQVTHPRADSDRDQQRFALPAVDVFEDAACITLIADMPGVPKEQLELKVEGDALLIEGAVQSLTPAGLEGIYAEVRVPRYRRSFTLSRELDTTRIEDHFRLQWRLMNAYERVDQLVVVNC